MSKPFEGKAKLNKNQANPEGIIVGDETSTPVEKSSKMQNMTHEELHRIQQRMANKNKTTREQKNLGLLKKSGVKCIVCYHQIEGLTCRNPNCRDFNQEQSEVRLRLFYDACERYFGNKRTEICPNCQELLHTKGDLAIEQKIKVFVPLVKIGVDEFYCTKCMKPYPKERFVIENHEHRIKELEIYITKLVDIIESMTKKPEAPTPETPEINETITEVEELEDG